MNVDVDVNGVEDGDRDRDGAGVEGRFEDETYYTIIGEDFKLCKRSCAVRNIYFLSIYGNGRAKGANPP